MIYPEECLLANWRLNLLDKNFIQNPYAYFTFLRECQPIHRLANGTWVITRYDDVKALLMHPSLGNSPSLFSLLNARNSEKYTSASLANNMIAFQDGEIHKQLRKQVINAFNKPINVTELSLPHVSSQLNILQDTEEFLAIRDMGESMALATIIDLLGIRLEHIAEDKPTQYRQLKQLTQDALYLFSQIPSHEDRERIDGSIDTLRQIITQSLERPSSSPVLSGFIELVALGSLPLTQAVDNIILLLVDGAENVDNLIASMLLWFRKYDVQAKHVIQDRSLIPLFVEECLRFETPVQLVGRVVQSEIALHGQTLKPNQSLLLMLGSANRDNTVYKEADTFDMYREKTLAMTFGRGSHTCLGNQLVRKIMCLVLEAVLNNMPNYRVVDSGFLTSPQWQNRMGHRWVMDYLMCKE